ncbi:MAG: LysR family transcriptional regulator [Polyangiaceae bacterium]|nr:LysR family transcriptional regulator [Polyangiaceae bacterium]
MRAGDPFEGLHVFLAVARRKSFRAAAKDLGVTAGAVSQSIRALEGRVGLPLFQRTTRSVALTEAGQSLFSRLAPASDAIGAALDTLVGLRERPAGLLKLTVPHKAVPFFIEPVLPRMREEHPDVTIEVSVDDAFVDLGKAGFDAGIRIGESVAVDMVGVRLSEDLRWHVVGAPSYFATHGHPAAPRDLLRHAAIRYRPVGPGAIYRWEFMDGAHAVVVDVPGPITVNDGALAIQLARRGLGLVYAPDFQITRDLAEGTLVTTLDAYAPTSAGIFLYFAAGAQTQPKLRAFIDVLLAVRREATTGPPAPKHRAARRSHSSFPA